MWSNKQPDFGQANATSPGHDRFGRREQSLDAKDRVAPPAFDRILVGIDGDRVSDWAVQVAVRLATTTGAAVALLNVVDLSRGLSPELGFMDETTFAERQAAAEHLMNELQGKCFAGWRPVRLIRQGDPAMEIVAAAEEWGADLIVVGTHAHGAVARFLLGSTAESVVRRARCPVLTVSHDPSAAQPAPRAPAAAIAGSET